MYSHPLNKDKCLQYPFFPFTKYANCSELSVKHVCIKPTTGTLWRALDCSEFTQEVPTKNKDSQCHHFCIERINMVQSHFSNSIRELMSVNIIHFNLKVKIYLFWMFWRFPGHSMCIWATVPSGRNTAGAKLVIPAWLNGKSSDTHGMTQESIDQRCTKT